MFALFTWLGRIPQQLVEAWWERYEHARLLHVASPVVGWILSVMWPAGLLIATLVWSLFGERVDARRDLQAALATKPPKTQGGPACCRHCDAPLDVQAGALGVRCPYCGADNLVQVPAAWAQRATKIDAALRLNASVAQGRKLAGQHRVRRAMWWRLPFVVGLLALTAVPAYRARSHARWDDFRLHPGSSVGVYVLAIQEPDGPTHALHSYATCAKTTVRKRLLDDSQLPLAASHMCDKARCEGVAMFALARGDRLRLVWQVPGLARARIALAPSYYLGGVAVLWDGFGDAIFDGMLVQGAAGDTAIEVPIEVSGWYKIDLYGAVDVVVEPCLGDLAAKS
jgi:hypothetical protein